MKNILFTLSILISSSSTAQAAFVTVEEEKSDYSTTNQIPANDMATNQAYSFDPTDSNINFTNMPEDEKTEKISVEDNETITNKQKTHNQFANDHPEFELALVILLNQHETIDKHKLAENVLLEMVEAAKDRYTESSFMAERIVDILSPLEVGRQNKTLSDFEHTCGAFLCALKEKINENLAPQRNR